MLLSLLKRYWDVSILKESPANTPYSFLLLMAFIVVFYVVIITQWSMVEVAEPLTFSSKLIAGFALMLSYALYTYVLLRMFQFSERFLQTLTCLYAAHTIVHLFAYPLVAATPLLGKDALPQTFEFIVMFVYLILTILLTAWQLMVSVYIYKIALSVENLSAILATIGLFAMNILVVSFVR